MVSVIKLRKGLDINLKGRAKEEKTFIKFVYTFLFEQGLIYIIYGKCN